MWHAWYASGIAFHATEGKHEPRYIIKDAISVDGISWLRENHTCVQPLNDLESNTRPTVVHIGEEYHMWFCYRGAEQYRGGKNSYRIGYASSTDLKEWIRRDAGAGIEPSEAGWDSQIQAYPYVVGVKDQLLMFYNGNGFGASGFGYALGVPRE